MNIYATVSGRIESVNKSSGDKVVKDDVLCVIEVPDQGYSMQASITADQAKRIRVGDVGTTGNMWGSNIEGTIISIKTDPTNPQSKRIVEFNLEGDVKDMKNDTELTLVVGSKSAAYDMVVPKSAVLSDNNGTFVLKIESKSSALGNRYFAKRVDVQVVAEDDNNRAITGDLQQYSDHVITNSSAKVNSGDQIRLSDEN